MFGYDLGIDLGTTKLTISVPGKGIVLDEPSYVACDTQTDKVLYAGKRAYFLEGREPLGITVIQPIQNGVVGNYSLCRQMLRIFINKVIGKSLFRPRVVATVPALSTDVEKRTIISSLIHAGARSVCLVEEPLCAAFGAGIDPLSPTGAFVIDIGGGTTDMAVISQGSMSQIESVKIAGCNFDDEIVKYLKNKHDLLVGLRTAEEIKKNIACAVPRAEDVKTFVKGQYILNGLPREIEIGGNELYDCLKPLFEEITAAASALFERTSPQLMADITNSHVILTGGSAGIYAVEQLFSNALGGAPVEVARDPVHCAARGTEVALNKMHVLDRYGYRYKTKEQVRIR